MLRSESLLKIRRQERFGGRYCELLRPRKKRLSPTRALSFADYGYSRLKIFVVTGHFSAHFYAGRFGQSPFIFGQSPIFEEKYG